MENLRNIWEESYSSFWQKFDACFAYSKTARRAREYVRGLMAGIERKNGWQLAEFIGDDTPYAVQNFLSRAVWSADAARDKLIDAAKECILTDSDQGCLIVDETGFLKKGTHSAGVKRQYSGTAGRIENSQIGVFLALTGTGGHALIDRKLYLPRDWCDDRERCKAVGIPEDICFHTKQQLAMNMLDRAFSSGIRPKWVLADALYGSSYEFRKFLLDRAQPYVVAISRQQCVAIDYSQIRVEKAIEKFPGDKWIALACGAGTKGKRLYEWCAIRLCWPASEGMAQYLMARRNIKDQTDIAYYFCHASIDISLEELALAAGQRWHIERCFEEAKQQIGLDEYEVRSWDGWHRHITLVMIGLLLLNLFKNLGNSRRWEKKDEVFVEHSRKLPFVEMVSPSGHRNHGEMPQLDALAHETPGSGEIMPLQNAST